MKKILIGGQRLKELGSDRHTDDIDYLIYDSRDNRLFIHDTTGVDLINAAQHPFYAKIWERCESGLSVGLNELLNISIFTFIQHCENFQFEKADAKEYDIKFLVRKILTSNQKIDYSIVKNFISTGAIEEVEKIIASVKLS